MARDNPVQNRSNAADDEQLPNLVTIVGRGVPSNYEIAVDGEIERVDSDGDRVTTIVSGGVAEGAIDAGVRRFRFSGEMANVRLVDWNGVPAPESPSTPTVHVQYGGSGR